MKKSLKTLAVLLCAALALLFTQCSKAPEDLIIGSWIIECTENTQIQDDETETEIETPEEGEQIVLTFNKDNTVVIEETEIEDGTTHITTSRGTYLIADNKLTLINNDEGDYDSQTYDIDLLDRKAMTLSISEAYDLYGHHYEYIFKIQLKKK